MKEIMILQNKKGEIIKRTEKEYAKMVHIKCNNNDNMNIGMDMIVKEMKFILKLIVDMNIGRNTMKKTN